MNKKVELTFERQPGKASATARQILLTALRSEAPVRVRCADSIRAEAFRFTMYAVRRRLKGAGVLRLTLDGASILIGRAPEEKLTVEFEERA